MVIFSEFPAHIQQSVLKKLNFNEFVKFKQCSRETVEMTNNFGHPLPLKVMELRFNGTFFVMSFKKNPAKREYGIEHALEEKVHIEAETVLIDRKMPKDKFAALEDICQKTKMTAKELAVYGLYVNDESAWMVDHLIKVLKPIVLRSQTSYTSYLSALKELQRIKRVVLQGGDLEESVLFQLKNPEIEISYSPVYPVYVNRFLKQWANGEREIEYLYIPLHRNNSVDIFKELVYTSWNGETFILKRNDGKRIRIEIRECGATLVAGEYHGRF